MHINIVSFSGGKDSTAMLHMILERNISVHEVVCFECEWDFPQMAHHLEIVERKTGIEIVKVRSYRYFNELQRRWGMPHKSGGWCTAKKRDVINTYIRAMKRHYGVEYSDITEYIGFAADEAGRSEKPSLMKKKWNVSFPLIDWGVTESEALEYCYGLDYSWGGLYEIFRRVSCVCCPKALGREEKVRQHFPDLHKKFVNQWPPSTET